MNDQPIDWDALPGWRGKLNRPTQYEGERFTHATVLRHDPYAGQWWCQVRPPGFWPTRGWAWWEEHFPDRAVPQDQPLVWGEDGFDADGLPIRFLATEWRPELAFTVDHHQMMREQLFVERFPRKEGEYDGLIEALANMARMKGRRR